MVEDAAPGLRIRYVGPHDEISVRQGLTTAGAVLYVQPGGDGTVESAWRALRADAPAVRNFVLGGGRYLGICMGGYLAGTSPGFDLMNGRDADEHITRPGASVTADGDTLITVRWRGRPATLYFQDGPIFPVDTRRPETVVLATYRNGDVAAVVAPVGGGKVGLVGPHPEATADWYAASRLAAPARIEQSYGRDLLTTLLG